MSKHGYRKLALIMAITMVVSVFVRGPEPALAADSINFEPQIERYRMDPGLMDSVPTANPFLSDDFYESSLYSKQAVFTWDLPNDEVNSTTTLRYNIANGTRVAVEFNKIGVGLVEVRYALERYNYAVPDWETVSPSAYTVNAGGSRGYIPSTSITSNGAYGVLDHDYPAFSITNGEFTKGFSFRFDNYTVHFLWDYNNATFYYATSGIEPGRLYDFELIRGSISETKSVYVAQSPTFAPISHVQNPQDDTIVQVVEKGVPHEEDDMPGSTPQTLQIHLNTPTMWNDTNMTFTDPIMTPMATSIRLTNLGDMIDFQLEIDDINSATPTITGYPNATIDVQGGIMTVTLEDMEAGRLFGVEVRPNANTGATGIFTRYLRLPFGSAYTLMRFVVVTIGNDYFVRMWPYANIPGKYTMAARPEYEADPSIADNVAWIWSTTTGTETQRDIPTTIDIKDQRKFYRFMFEPDGYSARVLSQNLEARVSGSGVFLETPMVFNVQAARLERETNYFTGVRGELELSVRWDMGRVAILDELAQKAGGNITISYELKSALSPYVAPGPAFYTLDVSMDEGDLESAVFSDSDGTSLTGIVVKDINTLTEAEHYFAETTIRVPAVSRNYFPADGFTLPQNYFIYPEVYFVCIQPVAENGAPRQMGASPYGTFTLSGFVQPDVPAPQNIGAVLPSSNNQMIGFSYSFDLPALALKNYMDYYRMELEPADAEFELNFYISQVESALNTSFSAFSTADKKAASVIAEYNSQNGSVINFSDVSGAAAMPTVNGTDARTELRNGNIVCIAGVSLNEEQLNDMLQTGASMQRQVFDFAGLDKNQKYYVYSEIVILHRQADGSMAVNDPEQKIELAKSSKVSALAAITTKGEQTIPTPEEEVPSAPRVSPQAVEADNATIVWERIHASAGESIEYQVLRTYNTPMQDDLLSKNELDFNEVWDAVEATYKRGTLTSGESGMVMWSGTTWAPITENEYFYENPFEEDVRYAAYNDKTLTPNRIYYYYVRTVKTVNGFSTYSNWGRTTLTTKPVKSPSKLRIEPPRADPSYMNYDPQTQVMFSFEAEIIPERLGSEFNFYYQLKKEGESWGPVERMTDISMLSSYAVETQVKGTWKYLYKKSDLEPGKSYTIRVFTRDVNENDSMYSEPATFRTDVNQQDYDEQEELDAWLGYFKDELNKLLKNYYWTLTNTSARLELAYRQTMFSSLITEAVDANINLYSTQADNAVYYIPASSLLEANNANKGFRIVHGNMEIVIPPSAIDYNVNAVIADLNAKVKAGTIADYYVRLSLNWRDAGAVDGAMAATKSVEIRFAVVESSITAENWDKDMFDILAAEFLAYAEDAEIMDDIRENIEDGTTDEEMIKFISAKLLEIAEEMSDILDSEFKDVTDAVYSASPNKQFTIIAKDTQSLAIGNGYEYQGSAWVLRDTSAYAGGRAMYPAAAGIFVFTGRSASIDALTGTSDAAVITAIIYKYNLEDYFGTITAANLDRAANRDMLAGVVARISGAPKGAEPIDWLSQNKKLTLSKRNSQNPLEMQEALFLMVSLYEFKTNTKASNVQIKNYAITNSMTGLEDRYKTHVRAAFELGLYTNRNMQPAANIKVLEILNILGSLDKRVKL